MTQTGEPVSISMLTSIPPQQSFFLTGWTKQTVAACDLIAYTDEIHKSSSSAEASANSDDICSLSGFPLRSRYPAARHFLARCPCFPQRKHVFILWPQRPHAATEKCFSRPYTFLAGCCRTREELKEIAYINSTSYQVTSPAFLVSWRSFWPIRERRKCF